MEFGNFEIAVTDETIKSIAMHLTNEKITGIRRVCQRYGEEADDVRYYDVYMIDFPSGRKVLKKAGAREVFNYETYLLDHEFPVPRYCGRWTENGENWILIEYLTGNDLRDMTDELAISAADTLSQIQNAYWQNDAEEFKAKKADDRFEVYWRRILKRAAFIEREPEIRKAYQLFLDRQLTCPRTVSHGDFLQYNVMSSQGSVYAIDWGFGGIMPYSLDIARFIAHATEDRSAFPFYMNDGQKKLFCERVYEKLEQKPPYSQYLRDIQLAVLNEYVEFVEADEDENAWYYQHAVKLAQGILE